MKRWTVVASVTVAVLVVGAVFFVIATRPTSSYTNRLACTDYETWVVEGSSVNSTTAYGYAITTTSFTTTTNASATVGHTTVYGFTPPLFGTEVSGNATRSCTFIK